MHYEIKKDTTKFTFCETISVHRKGTMLHIQDIVGSDLEKEADYGDRDALIFPFASASLQVLSSSLFKCHPVSHTV